MNATRDIIRTWSDVTVHTPLLAYGLAGLNIAGFAIGAVFWYGDFIRASNPPLWAYPFIPDSPLSTLLFGAALILLNFRRPSDLLNRFAIVYNVKYGTWTMLYWTLYWARTGDFNPVSLLMFATHFGMAIEGLLLFQYLDRSNLRNTLVVFAWMILHDIVDYAPIAPGREGYGWYPPLPLGTSLVPVMMIYAILMTWLLSASLFIQSLVYKRTVKTNRLATQSVTLSR
ncbi:MAG: DUF1405 domain-containing protein [Chloroflexi bacterium]|nr:DUF1405 domain-containing protein [Chloroflexota bacterium]MCL5273274.1 DUF1405 domain-containing protein [Chloroflexota bacterium]